jgi:predicted CxxxxCH...CXXCH cytochrome family protein
VQNTSAKLLRAVVCVLAVTGVGCTCEGVVASTDAGSLDAGKDSGISFDAGQPDAGPAVDAGEPDAGATDAGEIDAGTGDDGGQPDAGPADGGGLPDAGAISCSLCHGSVDNAAPPLDVAGRTATNLRTIGAHQSHLKPSAGWHRDVACEDCHVVPTDISAPTHIDPSPAELTFSAVANANNVVSSFNGSTCNTWCHGAAFTGRGTGDPVWTTVDGSQAFCGACHGVPPPAPHPAATLAQCGTCHPNSAGLTFSDPARHIDGKVDLNLACNSCHGSTTNNAPPKALNGTTATTDRGVGAHQAHLGTASTWHRDTVCTDCHVVPSHIEDPGHIDTAPADLTWGPVARANGVTPAFNGTTCTAYCHGASMGGPAPTWTQVGTGQAACGSCHGLPPPAPHPAQANCQQCHQDIGAGMVFTQPQKHIDGTLDVTVACDSCHGSAGNPAPPVSTTGATATANRGVGAHRSHLGAKGWHADVTCDDCHVVPVTVSDPGHIDALPAEVTFGSSARSANQAPAWNGTTCTNTYCHNVGLPLSASGGTNNTPTWTTVDGTQDACGTCHGLPPTLTRDAGTHPTSTACSGCHGASILADGGWVADGGLHINGLVEVTGGSGACGSCHALPPPTGAHLKHSALAAPTYGALGTAAGLPLPTGYAFGCGQCHPMDSSRHLSGGRADIELSNVLAPTGSLKALSTAATYTPGGSTVTAPDGIPYTNGTCGNVYCHSAPSFATPSGVPTPIVDFTFTTYPITYPTYTVTATRTYASIAWNAANPGCSGCHGFPIRLNGATDTAMAGQGHSWLNATTGNESGHGWNHGFAPLPCRTCHSSTVTAANVTSRTAAGLSVYQPVAITGFGSHVNGQPDVFFDVTNAVNYVTPKSLVGATYNVANKTCSNVSCHLAQTQVKNGNPYREQVGVECNVCHQY